jgi:phosphoenolpyruvate carboxylase
MKQNIPGFYGFGSGLEHFMQKGDRDRLRSLYRRSLFFRTLVENSMQSLSKTNYALTRYMASDERFGDFWQSLVDEAQRTKRHLCEISGESELLENDPTLRDSIQLREDMILPILTIQQYALRELRKLGDGTSEGDRRETLEKMVVKSLAAAVNASRNAV